jgi:AAA+ ATPase superfamily predicted ATPase
VLWNVLPDNTRSVVVLDEVPYLVREDPTFEGSLQKAFDRLLVNRPVLLILVGSDVAMMEQLGDYGRPFHQRGTELIVPALTPRDVGDLTGLTAADALDAYLVSGGLPLVLEEWEPGTDLWGYLEHALARTTSALIVSGERSIAAEFPVEAQARTVLGIIGSGERTFTTIARTANLQAASLKRSLDLLAERRIVVAELPVSTQASRETRYRITDPYLRFWLSCIAPDIPLLERGRSDIVLGRIRARWASWRGRAIEPVIRESLLRMRDQPLLDASGVVGGYWTRTNNPEIDLIGADRGPLAGQITFVGSIKWHEKAPFDDRDLGELIQHRAKLPGANNSTPLLAVTRTGATATGATIVSPGELLAAW